MDELDDPVGPSLGVLVALLLIAAMWPLGAAAPVGSGVLVEVVGAVPTPGVHRLEVATLAGALAAAGLQGGDEQPIAHGDRVVVDAEGAHVEASADPLLYGLRVDVNRVGVEALVTIPRVGPATASAIVADREVRGPFYAVDDLDRVRGVGPSAIARMAPFVTVGDVGPRPPPPKIDLNHASAATLEQLPGIGPVTASRIVADRAANGPYRRMEDLDRVKGIGPKTVARVAPLVVLR